MMLMIVPLALFIQSLHAHSWVRCSDYKAEITGGDYDESQCEGWIRGWEYDGVTFGQDRGINYQVEVGGGQSLCQRSMTGSSSNNYGFANTDKIPSYTAGSSVRVVWPAKNHANYECFNYIPDTSMKLFFNPNVNPSADLPNTESTMIAQGYELVKDWHDGCSAGEDGCGFQNCPKFCENTDKATCFGDFTVPNVDTSGYYTFVWYWIFNPGSPYITCWEAYIEKSDGSTPSPVDDDQTVTPAPTTGTNPQGTISGYLTQIPVCIEGQSYNAGTLLNFVEDQFSAADAVTATYILSVDQTNSGYDFLAQVSHNSPGAEVTDIATTDFCANFVAAYGVSVTCDVSDDCGEVITFATYDNSGGNDNDDTTPSPIPGDDDTATPSPISGDSIVVSNDQSTQAYYLSFVMEHIDDCYNDIDAVQLDMGSGQFVDNDQYYYDNGHKYAFNYAGTTFSDLLPISLRILFTDGQFVDLDEIIADLQGDSVFTSAKSCGGTVIATPSPTDVVVEESTEDDPDTTSLDTTEGTLQDPSSGALRLLSLNGRGLVWVGLTAFAVFW